MKHQHEMAVTVARDDDNGDSDPSSSDRHPESTTTNRTTSQTPPPVLVLHIGPHKTATSTIQCELAYFREQLLQNSAYPVAFLGRKYGHCIGRDGPHSKVNFNTRDLIDDCFTNPSCNTTKVWKKLKHLLRDLSERKTSVILSDEAFSRMLSSPEEEDGVDNRQMLYSLLEKYYPGQVRVVIVYRRYYEWFLSLWNNGNKPYSNHVTESTKNPYKVEYRSWPSDGGKIPQSFLSHYEHTFPETSQTNSNGSRKEGGEKGKYSKIALAHNIHPVEYLRRLWSAYTSRIDILNMHDLMRPKQSYSHNNVGGDDIFTRFLHEILPTSIVGDTIRDLKKTGFGEGIGRTNPSVNLDYDLLAIRAQERGFLNSTLKRFQVARMIEAYLPQYLETRNSSASAENMNDTTPYKFPLICLNETEQKKFLERSLQYELQVSPYFANSVQQSSQSSYDAQHEHESMFWQAVERNKFCDIDTDKLIESSSVQEFFKHFNGEKTEELLQPS